jgi:hypothetical protein
VVEDALREVADVVRPARHGRRSVEQVAGVAGGGLRWAASERGVPTLGKG